VSTRALIPLLWFVAAGCDRGQLVLLPAQRAVTVGFDAAPPAPDQSAASPPRIDAGRPPFGGPAPFECNADDQCGGRRPFCELRFHRCVECVDQYGCQWPTVCDLFTERCALPCQANSDCSMTAQTRCDPNRHVCVGCTSNTQCVDPTRFCEPMSGQCVECLDDNDCAPPWRFCTLNRNECVECQNDQQCPPGEACGGGGRCFARM
jgi:hypothetical protein